MKKPTKVFTLEITDTEKACPQGEKAGSQCLAEGKIPVLSCEGGCIRGEIARLAANLVAKEELYRRGCHGEMFTAPHTAMADWMKKSGKVVVIDGCYMHCHGRIAENIVGKDNLVIFDALSLYRKYTDIIDIDAVPEKERKETARKVADMVLAELNRESGGCAGSRIESGSEAATQSAGCC